MDDAIHPKSTLKLSDWRVIATLGALAIAVILVVGAFALSAGSSDQDTARVVTGVQFPYPAGWSEQALTEDDRNAGLVLRLERDTPDASFLARTVIARTPADLDINELAADTKAALATEIEGFQLVSSDVVEVAGRQAVEVTYQQTVDTPPGTHWVRMTIVPGENQTFYLTFRAAAADFDTVENDGQQIVQDFVAYITASEQ